LRKRTSSASLPASSTSLNWSPIWPSTLIYPLAQLLTELPRYRAAPGVGLSRTLPQIRWSARRCRRCRLRVFEVPGLSHAPVLAWPPIQPLTQRSAHGQFLVAI
jgi:hypothetical protein